MDLTFLNDYVVLVIVGICVCIGYILKNSFPKLDNKYIPLIMAILGVILNIWIAKTITPEILLAGMFSGLASTGLHQVFVNLMQGK
ncbi:phage holin family protein [Terrisporobacter sp.]|uniref:phage holin family protein n=1 Tax=Terrisporobacter sp. TaxID=1965305 RepID=UPI00262B977B|nr:phage holin family protein [Terrisporobacter sp.]